MSKINKILLIILFLFLPLVNSHLFNLIWIDWGFYVNWNYEFSKVIFFNILSGIIILLFIINNIFSHKNKLKIPKIIFLIFLLLLISTIFSEQF